MIVDFFKELPDQISETTKKGIEYTIDQMNEEKRKLIQGD